MIILAVMQNQWFKEPERMSVILERGLARGTDTNMRLVSMMTRLNAAAKE